jgi:hypothetical protein
MAWGDEAMVVDTLILVDQRDFGGRFEKSHFAVLCMSWLQGRIANMRQTVKV